MCIYINKLGIADYGLGSNLIAFCTMRSSGFSGLKKAFIGWPPSTTLTETHDCGYAGLDIPLKYPFNPFTPILCTNSAEFEVPTEFFYALLLNPHQSHGLAKIRIN